MRRVDSPFGQQIPPGILKLLYSLIRSAIDDDMVRDFPPSIRYDLFGCQVWRVVTDLQEFAERLAR